MLKDIVDDTSLGKYDFMYLRIGRLSFQRYHFMGPLTSRSFKILPTTASMIRTE